MPFSLTIIQRLTVKYFGFCKRQQKQFHCKSVSSYLNSNLICAFLRVYYLLKVGAGLEGGG